jgi:hypothetical protein
MKYTEGRPYSNKLSNFRFDELLNAIQNRQTVSDTADAQDQAPPES